jgi:hypothetical protein
MMRKTAANAGEWLLIKKDEVNRYGVAMLQKF